MKNVWLSLVLLLSTTSFALAASDFPDVPKEHENYEAILYLRDRGIIDGYPDGTFKPEKPISRAETLKILLLGSQIIPEEKQSHFPDVPQTHWGQKYIFEAEKRGIVNGHPDGTFRADDIVSLAAVLKMLLLVNDINPETPTTPPFSDTPLIEWFTPYAAYAKEKKIIDNGEAFNPSKQLTRGDVSELMYRLSYIQENELQFFQVTNERKVTIVKVYDGDTLTTDTEEKIRIIGINAPEKGEDYDEMATEKLEGLVLNKEVTIIVCENPRDRYGRTLAALRTAEGIDPAIELLKSGLAKTYYLPPCGSDTKVFFEELEQEAQKNEKGIWSIEKDIDEAEDATEQMSALIMIEAHPNAKDPDADHLNDEYLVIQNNGADRINLKGFILSDEQNHTYSFPSIIMEPGEILTIYTGQGITSNTEFYLDLDGPIWNNGGDTLTIQDTSGNIILQKEFKGNKKF